MSESVLPAIDRELEAFWSKVDRSGGQGSCWLWLGAKTPTGYGNLMVAGRYTRPHRFVWGTVNFKIPKTWRHVA